MISAQLPKNEKERLKILHSYNILDTSPQESFDDITEQASSLLDTPIALISLVDESRQWFKSMNTDLGLKETPLEHSICSHSILTPNEILELEHIQEDQRFTDYPFEHKGKKIKFYAGYPLLIEGKYPFGTLCVMDTKPRVLTDKDKQTLIFLAKQVCAQLTLHKQTLTLQASEQQHKDLINNIADIIYEVDDKGVFLLTNSVLPELTGYSTEEIHTKKITDLIHKQDTESYTNSLKKALEKKKTTFHVQYRLVTKSGSHFWVGQNTFIEYTDDSYHLRAIVRNISEIKKLEKEIQKNEGNLTAIINNSPEMIWSVNLDHRLIIFNNVFKKRILPFSSQNLSPGDTVPHVNVDDKSSSFWLSLYKRAFGGERFVEEWESIRSNKTKILEYSFNPMRDKNGAVTGAVVFARDITTKIKEQERIKKFLLGLRILNELSSDLTKEHDKKIQNALKVVSNFIKLPTGIISNIIDKTYSVSHSYSSSQEMSIEVGSTFNLTDTYCEITYNSNEVTKFTNVSKSKHKEHPCYLNTKLETYIGAIIYVNDKRYGTVNFTSPVPRDVRFDDYDAEFIQLFANWIGAEIERKTNLGELENAKSLAEANAQAKGDFLATMTHEIRTPLNAIIGVTHLLKDDTPREDQKQNIELLEFSSENLLALVNDILDFNKIEEGQIVLEKVDFDLYKLLNNIKLSQQNLSEEKNVSLNLYYDKDAPLFFKGDPVRIAQVINNLVSNALKFTDKGEVKISLEVLRKEEKFYKLLFTVQDTGIGIPQNKLDTIFDRYTQAETDTTRKFGGTGLGLTITKKLLALMATDIKVVSEMGKGSTFSFDIIIPKGNSDKEYSKTKTPETNFQITSDQKHYVLVAEDHKPNQVIIQSFLSKWGIDVDIANNGQEAFELTQKNKYDLILMDIQMPVLNGFEASNKIRSLDDLYYKEIPILALSASTTIEDREQAKKIGIIDFIPKPFDPNDLHQKINKYIYLNKRNSSSKNPINKSLKQDFPYYYNLLQGDTDIIIKILKTVKTSIINELTSIENNLTNKKEVLHSLHKIKPHYKSLNFLKSYDNIEILEINLEKDFSTNQKYISILLEELLNRYDFFNSKLSPYE